MQRLLILLALSGAIGAAPAPAQQPLPARPTGFAPGQVEAVYKDGFLVLHYLVAEYRTETKIRDRTTPDGKVVKEEYTVTIPVFQTKEVKFDAKKSVVYRAGGKDLAAIDLPKALEKPTIVFVAHDRKRVDSFFLQFLADDALIVLPPPPAAPLPIPTPREKPS